MSKRHIRADTGSPSSKRNRTHRSEWGLSEVLAECGCLLRAAPDADDDEPRTDVGCQLEPRVTPTTLCSSLNALLNEMAGGTDPDNAKVLESLEETLGRSIDDFGGENTEKSTLMKSSLLRRMLLPMYRNRGDMLISQMSQISQSPSRSVSGIKIESYSLIQVLLRIEKFQNKLLTGLVQLLPEIATKLASDGEQTLGEDVPKLIFQNLRWLDHVFDSSSLIETFNECLTVLSSGSADCPKTRAILLDAIATMPELFNNYNAADEEGTSVMMVLQMLRREDPTLLIPCLDAFDSMPLSPDSLEIAMEDALEALANTEAWGLPALTTFLINNCPRGGNGMAKRVIEEFRELPLGVSGDDMVDESEDRAVSGTVDTESLMIEALSRGFAHRMDLTSTLLKSIKETKSGYHKPADIWLLACCASASHNKSPVKTVFRSKANDGSFTSQMIQDTIKGNSVALTSLFGTSLCDLADSLLRSTDADVCEIGVTLYVVLFEEFKEPMQRQEVVGSLVTHVGAGVGSKQSEVDAAMRAFSSIISKTSDEDKESGAAALRQFTPFLTSLLEHLLQMTSSQVRKLFMLLFTIGTDNKELRDGCSPQDGGAINEASIIIKKYLGLQDDAKKRIGIIGAVSFAVSMSTLLGEDKQKDSAAASSSADHPIVKDIKTMINAAFLNCKPPKSLEITCGTTSIGASFGEGRSTAFLMYELGCAVRSGKMLPSIREWLDEFLIEDFEQTFVRDFVDENTQSQTQKMGKGVAATQPEPIPTSKDDVAILNGTSENALAPPGEMRYHLQPHTAIYIPILSLLSAPGVAKREVLPLQLCPQLSLIASLKNERYGGDGLKELDALIEAPLFLPRADCSGLEFTDLSPDQQWTVTASFYFATCWTRELINNFIHGASPDALNLIIPSASSQVNAADIKQMMVTRLRNLIELQDELRLTSSKCYHFAPPGLDIVVPPKELLERDTTDVSAKALRDIDPNDESAVKKAHQDAKKLAAKHVKQQEKSKLKKINAKRQYEKFLGDRTMSHLRPLDSSVCIALGYPELRACEDYSSSQLSVTLTQNKQVKLAEPAALLLLEVLQDTLTRSLSNKRTPWFRSNDAKSDDCDAGSNPYGAANHPDQSSKVLLATCDVSHRECFVMLGTFLEADVFCAMFEHLATIEHLRAEDNIYDENSESRLITTSNILFNCITTILSSKMLTQTTTGKCYLGSILKALAEGTEYDRKACLQPVDNMTDMLFKMLQLLTSILDSHTDDMDFVMNGVSCMAAIDECARRLGGENNQISTKLAKFVDSMLRRGWPDDVKLNKSNVGKMLSLLLDNSYIEIPSNSGAAAKVDIANVGRMKTLRLLVNDVLSELPHTEKCMGPVDLFQTCTSQTFGCYYSIIFSYLHKELSSLFDSSLGKTKDPTSARRTLEIAHELVQMMKSLFKLTKDNESLAKKHPLLQQLKWGSRFIETFVSKAIPFFHTHFHNHQESIIIIITDAQKTFKQMYHIISHGKRVKDANLGKETPRAKKAMELFTHKVKALLKKNRCLTAMTTKILESKGIDGMSLKYDDGTIQDKSDQSDEDDDDENSEAGYETEDQSVED